MLIGGAPLAFARPLRPNKPLQLMSPSSRMNLLVEAVEKLVFDASAKNGHEIIPHKPLRIDDLSLRNGQATPLFMRAFEKPSFSTASLGGVLIPS